MEELLLKLMKLNIDVRVEDGNLKLNVPHGLQVTDLLQEVRSNKQQLCEYITQKNHLKNTTKAIERSADKAYYRLSSAQKRLYFIYELDRSSVLYNMQQMVRLKGRIERKRLEDAFVKLIERHESLRTCFMPVQGDLMQKISSEVFFEIESFDARHEDETSIVSRFVRPFDLSNPPLIRVGLIERSSEENVLMVDVHHIVVDGISMNILIDDFALLYKGETLPPPRLQYKDYVEWQQRDEQQSEINRQKQFWLNQFSKEVETLDLPMDFARSEAINHKGSPFNFSLPEKETGKLNDIARGEGVTMFTLLLAVYNILLSKLSNQEDIVVGSAISGRQHDDLENIVGMVVNTLPLRNYPKGPLSFKQFLSDVKTRLLACLENKAYPYEELISELNPERDVNRNPLFDTMFTFNNFGKSVIEFPGLRIEPYDHLNTVSRFDLTFSAYEDANQLFLCFEYNVELFKEETIQRFSTYFKNIISTITVNTNVALSEIELPTGGERDQLLKAFNNTTLAYDRNETVLSLFDGRLKQTPDDIAVVFEDKSITYRDLNSQANIVAGKIRSVLKSCKGARIAIMTDPSVEMVIGMLAILKVGSVYVPLSPETPRSRNEYVYRDCHAQLMLVQASLMVHGAEVVSFADEERIVPVALTQGSSVEIENIQTEIIAEDSIYVIYTSGTTGNPKGVEIAHRGLVNMLEFYRHLYPISETTRMSQVAHVCFDATAFEIWPSIVYGGCLFIAPVEVRADPTLMKQWLFDHKVEITFQPTVIAEMLLRENWNDPSCSLKVMNVAGDKLRYFPKKNIPFRLYNLYGPTEDSIWTTWTEIKSGDVKEPYCIGKPIANKKVYILNKYNHLVPVGVPGELCVSGDGLAKGYVNRKELTEQKFVDDPFEPGGRIYKTGDLARWSSKGTIEFLGRIDSQVKIRGFRVELGEIENHLSGHDRIKESVAVINEAQANKYIVAYYVSIEPISSAELRNFLLEKLPNYMMPLHYVWLKKMPVTTSGKLDRRALPEPKIEAADTYVAPSNDIEEKLVEIWAKALNLEKEEISVNDSFFDLGGHSLIAPILISDISRELNVSFHLRILFKYQTISALSSYISENRVMEQAYS